MNKKNNLLVGLLILAVAAISLTACGNQESNAGLANPASVYCGDQGYELEIREDEEGNQYGVCMFPDGSECEEWAYYNGECAPGDEPAESEEEEAAPPIGLANPAAVYCEELGYGSETREDADGNQSSVCIFPDGSECDQWAFFRGECGQAFSYCEQQGHTLEAGDGMAECVFSDGSSCLEIDFFNGDCGPES